MQEKKRRLGPLCLGNAAFLRGVVLLQKNTHILKLQMKTLQKGIFCWKTHPFQVLW